MNQPLKSLSEIDLWRVFILNKEDRHVPPLLKTGYRDDFQGAIQELVELLTNEGRERVRAFFQALDEAWGEPSR